MSTHFDSIIIGAGQAGPTLAGRLTQSGRSVAFIERKLFGGTCVNTGCTPTKTMVASAYVAQKTRTAADYGVTVQGRVSVDMKAVKARKDKVVAASPGIELTTAPEGYVKIHPNHHLWSKLRIGQAQLDGQFKVLYESELIEPNPFPKGYQ